MGKYVLIQKKDVPAGLRFDVPQQNQGQHVVIAYGDSERCRYLACHGSPYKRITDRSGGLDAVLYYRWVESE